MPHHSRADGKVKREVDVYCRVAYLEHDSVFDFLILSLGNEILWVTAVQIHKNLEALVISVYIDEPSAIASGIITGVEANWSRTEDSRA